MGLGFRSQVGDVTAKEKCFAEKWGSWSAQKGPGPVLLPLRDCRRDRLAVPSLLVTENVMGCEVADGPLFTIISGRLDLCYLQLQNRPVKPWLSLMCVTWQFVYIRYCFSSIQINKLREEKATNAA